MRQTKTKVIQNLKLVQRDIPRPFCTHLVNAPRISISNEVKPIHMAARVAKFTNLKNSNGVKAAEEKMSASNPGKTPRKSSINACWHI